MLINSLVRRLLRTPAIALAWKTAQAWHEDRVPRLAASLSYYTIFSLAPLLVIVLAALGQFADRAMLQRHLVVEVTQMLGARAGEAVADLLDHATATVAANSPVAALVGMALLIVGAIGVVVELKGSLNLIWRVSAAQGGAWRWIRTYFAPLTLVLGIGFLLLISLLFSAGLAAVAAYFDMLFPAIIVVVRVLDQIVANLLVIVLFALIYRILPDARLRWGDVWLGAVCAGVMFTVGRFFIGLYLGRAAFTSAFGAAGSLVVVLAWVYYSAQILLIGAEFTRVHAEHRGRRGQTTSPTLPIAPAAS